MDAISFVSSYFLKEVVLNTWTGELMGFFDQWVTSTALTPPKGVTFQTQSICVQVEADGSVSASGMIWMNLKEEVRLGNALCAMNLAIGTLIVPLSSLGVDEATGEEEEEEAVEE